MKKVGLLVAVEIKAVLERYGEPAEVKRSPAYEVLVYRFENYELNVLKCGAGEIAAAAGTQYLISVIGAEVIINYGIVGGLTEAMHRCNTVVVERVVHYQFDTSAIDPVKPGRYIEYPDVYIPMTDRLIEKAVEVHPSLTRVTCASGDKFIGSEEDRRYLHETFGADICEMEAAAVALTCDRNGIPFLCIKTISDSIFGGAGEYSLTFDEAAGICLEITDRIIQSL